MSRIRCRSIALMGTAAILPGVWFSAQDHTTPASPHASAAVAHVEPLPLTGHPRDVMRQVVRGAGDQAVARVSPVTASVVFVGSLGGVARAESIVQQATFIHHMIIGRDSASVSPPSQLLTC
jgi:hypothetical protein